MNRKSHSRLHGLEGLAGLHRIAGLPEPAPIVNSFSWNTIERSRMNSLLFMATMFLATWATLQVFGLVVALIVDLLFPEWQSAKDRLRIVNARSLQYAFAATMTVLQYFPWALMVLFAVLTVVYS